MQQIPKRLSRDTGYKPTGLTYQQKLSNEEIENKLIDYVKVKSSDINKIPLNTHIRYFSINPKTGEKQFRLGGNLIKIEEKYIVLSNGQLSWSVQLNNSTIYKKMLTKELIEDTKINTAKELLKNNKMEGINSQMDQLLRENKELKKMIKEIKTTTLENKKKK